MLCTHFWYALQALAHFVMYSPASTLRSSCHPLGIRIVYSPRVLLLSGTGLEELFREHFSLTLGWVGRIERPGCKAQGMCGQHREPGVGLDRAAGARFASLSYPVMPGTAACKPIRWKAESRIGDSRVKAPNRPQLCQEGSDSGTDVLLRAGRLGFKLHTWQSR